MLSFTPFFINSNLITNKSSLTDYNTFFNAVAGNTGNSYITWALLKELGISELKDEFHIQNIYDFDFSYTDKVAEFVNSNCSHVFLILQDQIRIQESYDYKLPYEGIKKLLEKINLPVIVAGLGANSFTGFDSNFHKQLPKDLIEFLHYLSARCNELGVRGNFTAEVLNQLEIKNVIPIGCPSYFETGANRVITKKSYISPSKILFTSNFFNSLNDTNFQVCQDHQEQEIVKLIAFNELGNSYENEHLMLKYSRRRYKIFSSISDWKNFASHFDFSIGYRVHGSILALNSGCLAVCCNEDSRAREMCELLKITWMPAPSPDTNLTELYKSIDISELNTSYPQLYDNFSSFILKNCGINLSKNLSSEKNPEACSIELYKDYSEIISENLLKVQFEYRRERERESDELALKLSNISTTIEEQRATIEEQRTTIEEQRTTIDNLNAATADCRFRLEENVRNSELEIAKMQKEINSMYTSRSWRITKPLRFLMKIYRNLFRRNK